MNGSAGAHAWTAAGDPKPFTFTLDAARSFALDLGGHGTAAGHGRGGTDPDHVDMTSHPGLSTTTGSLTLRFLVPADFRSGTLRFTPHGTFTYGGQRTSWSSSPGYAPEPEKITLG